MTTLLRTKLYEFQRRAARLGLHEDAIALFLQQGLGKTVTALKIIAVRWRRHSLRRVLIIGPKNVSGVWPRQANIHLNIPFQFADDISTVPINPDVLTFLFVNYERSWRILKELRRIPWDMVIADEAHRIRHRNSRQSKALWKIGLKSKYRLALTGTPIGEDERDLFGIFRFVDPEVFGTRWAAFEKRYMKRRWIQGKGGQEWPKVRMTKEGARRIVEKAAPLSFYASADEVLDLPPVTDHAITFDLTGRAAEAYQSMERDFVYEFEDLTSTTPLAITKMLRLHQLTGGHLGMDNKSLLRLEQDKLLTLSDWLDDFPRGEKLVVFAKFTPEVDLLCELMEGRKRSYVVRDGRTKQRDLNLWMDFQDKSSPSTYIAQISSGGVGTELFRSRYGVFYSNCFSRIDYEQARKRIARNGQTRPVLFIHMTARGTIDEDIYEVQYQHRLTANRILRSLQLRGRQHHGQSRQDRRSVR